VAFSPDGQIAYVVGQERNELIGVTVGSGQVKNRIPVGRGPHGVASR